MNAIIPKRSHHKKKLTLPTPPALGQAIHPKPSLGYPDALEAAQEACRLAQEGNVKLASAVDCLRQGLETITVAEFDRTTQQPVSAPELRTLAAATLDAYSHLTGQSWRRHKLIGSRAGDRNLNGLKDQGYVDHG